MDFTNMTDWEDEDAFAPLKMSQGAKTFKVTAVKEQIISKHKDKYAGLEVNDPQVLQKHKLLVLELTLENCKEAGFKHSEYLSIFTDEKDKNDKPIAPIAFGKLRQIFQACIGENPSQSDRLIGEKFDGELVPQKGNSDFFRIKDFKKAGELTSGVENTGSEQVGNSPKGW